jgi:hypothetical protein
MERPSERLAIVVFFAACGCAVTYGFDTMFAGEESWGLSAGIGFAMLSFVAELGSPTRYTREELRTLEAQYEDFRAFADARLRRAGRCHVTEISSAFRRAHAEYADVDVLSESDLRTMILNWYPNAERTSGGYYKNVSLAEIPGRTKTTVKELGL